MVRQEIEKDPKRTEIKDPWYNDEIADALRKSASGKWGALTLWEDDAPLGSWPEAIKLTVTAYWCKCPTTAPDRGHRWLTRDQRPSVEPAVLNLHERLWES